MDDSERLRTPMTTSVPGAVADTMRRVQEQLQRGVAPSFEAMLAFGEPGHGPAARTRRGVR